MFELDDPVTLLAEPVSLTLTAGELIERLSGLNPNTPIIAYSDATDYINVTDLHYAPDEGPAAVLEITPDYDARQW